MKKKLPPNSFLCFLPLDAFVLKTDGNMRVCCTANACKRRSTNDKEHGGQVGVLRTADGVP